MKVILTGITGNLGHELYKYLIMHGVEIIPCVRPGKAGIFVSGGVGSKGIIESDLTKDLVFSGDADCIIHCAGVVHFQRSGNQNEAMMQRVVALASKLSIPVHFISTAFAYKSHGVTSFSNAYEQDKYNAERLLLESGVPHSIFRPSVLVGDSVTGAIQNFNGYYLIVEAFLSSIRAAMSRGRQLRFLKMTGKSDIVPVDQAAKCIADAIMEGRLESLFVTNPAPPSAKWILDETLSFFGVNGSVQTLDMTFEDFGALDLTEEEAVLYKFSRHFYPYWSKEYTFPATICPNNAVNHDYLFRVLTYFKKFRDSHAR